MFKPFVRRGFTNMCYGYQKIFSSTEGDIDNLLVTYLKIDNNLVKQMNQLKKSYISKIPKQKVIQNCIIINELNVNLNNLRYLDQCLNLQPVVTKHRILILKEMGVKNLDLCHIYRFPTTMRRSLKQFKKVHDISPTDNIMKNIINHLGLAVDEIIINKFDDNIKTGDYYQLCMNYYKTVYLHLKNNVFYRSKRCRYQSFKEVTELLNILQTKYNFDYQFLCKNTFLLKLDKHNVERYLTEFGNSNIVRDLNIVKVAKKFPRILCYPSENLKELFMLCKDLEISHITVISYLRALNLNKEEFITRYQNILNSTELKIWLKHPRVLKLIEYHSMVETRVEYLKLCNRITIANIQTYLCNDVSFVRYIQGNMNHTSSKKYLSYILCKEFGEDKAYLIHHIKKHSHWKVVPLLFVDQTVKYLKQNYSAEDICKNIQLIFYSQSTISKAMNIINEEYTSAKGYNFSSSQYLALCLYIIEKEYHFTGDAVWQGIHEHSVTDPKIPLDIKNGECKNVMKGLVIDDKVTHNLNNIAWLEYLLR